MPDSNSPNGGGSVSSSRGEEGGPSGPARLAEVPSTSISDQAGAAARKAGTIEDLAVREGQWTRGKAEQFENKGYSQYMDPCQDAAKRSYDCLRRNDGDRDMCLDYFEAYRKCKKVWLEERRKARGSWW